MSDPILTEKGNIQPPEVWVTFWNIYDGDRAYLGGLSEKPWEPDYDAPITKYADNVRYVPASLLEAAEQREKLAYTAGYVDGATGCPHRVTSQIGVAVGDET